MMRFGGLLLSAALCAIFCTGCSSPYLPHNAFKYIPEFSYEEKQEEETATTGQEDSQMDQESWRSSRSYFSLDSIRERYAQHISDTSSDTDLLLEIACDTVELMRRDGKSDDEIRAVLTDKFLFSSDTLDDLLSDE